MNWFRLLFPTGEPNPPTGRGRRPTNVLDRALRRQLSRAVQPLIYTIPMPDGRSVRVLRDDIYRKAIDATRPMRPKARIRHRPAGVADR